MYNIHCLNKIAEIGLNGFSADYNKEASFEEADAVLVRSAKMHDMEFGADLKAIARAGAGVNNIPLDRCAEEGIVVFNTPGANANGVKELVIAGMLLASRDIIGGINWVQTAKDDENIAALAEKEKSKFAGSEIKGKKLGVIGLGAIGAMVANAAVSLGMEVYGYDPYISIKSAWSLSREVKYITNVEDIYKECDFITVHVPLMDSTKESINKAAFDMMKDGVVILNFARDLLVNEKEIGEALASGKVKSYVTDFPNPTTAGMPGTIVIPHLGASTEESEDNCAIMAVNQIRDYLENGNIINSVNYPACDMGVCAKVGRIAVNHKNVPAIISQITTIFGDAGINISDMMNKSRNDFAYSLFDLDNAATAEVVSKIEAVDGVIRVRIIK